jgi:hypothetical protein
MAVRLSLERMPTVEHPADDETRHGLQPTAIPYDRVDHRRELWPRQLPTHLITSCGTNYTPDAHGPGDIS